jgi:hypothetical protein
MAAARDPVRAGNPPLVEGNTISSLHASHA